MTGGMSGEAAACLASQIADPETQWSLGTFGAIAEFLRDPDEPADVCCEGAALSAVTGRGGLRLVPDGETRLFAFETTTRECWSPRVAICLPADRSAMSRRTVLTELGPDDNALRGADRRGILFDLGLGAMQVDVCVRVQDPDVAAQLRAHCGEATFAPGNPAGGLLLAHSPHRVFVSRIGRAEVYQPIPPAHGKSPEGPHTHVLLDLLRHRRTHAATEPIPDSLVPCGHFYPAHPVRDSQGRPRPFDANRHAAFQALLRRFGDPRTVALQERVRSAVSAGEQPAAVRTAESRFARTEIRVALRQLQASEQNLPSLADWLSAYERAGLVAAEEEPYAHHR